MKMFPRTCFSCILLAGLLNMGLPLRGSEPLSTVLGSGIVLTLPADLTRVALADEDIARVNILNAREVLIHGTKIGQTTVFAWFENEPRRDYILQVQHDLDLLMEMLLEMDDRIRVDSTPDGSTVVLRGQVGTAGTVGEAERRALAIVSSMPPPQPNVLNLLTTAPGEKELSEDEQLAIALSRIDPRIRLRRIVVNARDAGTELRQDSLVLEGRVQTINELLQAVTLAERQLGGMGNAIKASDNTRITENRLRNFNQNVGGGSGGRGGNSSGGGGDSSQDEMPPQGLAAQLARGLIVTSESGRVVSFLEVDDLQQILVSIRVLEIDRGRARREGIDYVVNAKNFSVGGFNLPGVARITAPTIEGTPSIIGNSSLGNVVGAYVGDSLSILGAIDLMEEVGVARSVAEPNVLTLTGEEASVRVGGEIPIPTTAVGDVAAVQGFQFQTFGVSLNLRPTINADGIITLEVAPNITVPNAGLGNGQVPGFEVQSVQTIARVRTGESLVIGGLLTYREEVKERKIPILGHIPLVGLLFSWDSKSRSEQELLFVMTPKVIEDAEEGLEDPVLMPGTDFRNNGFRVDLEPTGLDPEGVPLSWREEQAEIEEEAAQDEAAAEAEERHRTERQLKRENTPTLFKKAAPKPVEAAIAPMPVPEEEVDELFQTNEVDELLQTEEVDELLQTQEVDESLLAEEIKESPPVEEAGETLPAEEVEELLQTEEVDELLQTQEVDESLLADVINEDPPAEEAEEILPAEEVGELLQTDGGDDNLPAAENQDGLLSVNDLSSEMEVDAAAEAVLQPAASLEGSQTSDVIKEPHPADPQANEFLLDLLADVINEHQPAEVGDEILPAENQDELLSANDPSSEMESDAAGEAVPQLAASFEGSLLAQMRRQWLPEATDLHFGMSREVSRSYREVFEPSGMAGE